MNGNDLLNSYKRNKENERNGVTAKSLLESVGVDTSNDRNDRHYAGEDNTSQAVVSPFGDKLRNSSFTNSKNPFNVNSQLLNAAINKAAYEAESKKVSPNNTDWAMEYKLSNYDPEVLKKLTGNDKLSQKEENRQYASEVYNYLKESNPEAYEYLSTASDKGATAKNMLTNITQKYADVANETYKNSGNASYGTASGNALNMGFQAANSALANTLNAAANSIQTQTYKDLVEKYGMSPEEAAYWDKNYQQISGIISNAEAENVRNEYIANYSDEVKSAMQNYIVAKRNVEKYAGHGYTGIGTTDSGYTTKYQDSIKKLEELGVNLQDEEYALLEQYIEQNWGEIEKNFNDTATSIAVEKYPALTVPLNYNSLAFSPYSGMAATAGTFIDNAMKPDKSQPTDTNKTLWNLQNMDTLTQNVTNEAISRAAEANGHDPKYGQFAYGVGYSTAKSLYSMALGSAVSSNVAPAISAELGLTGKSAEKVGSVVAQLVTLPSFGTSAYSSTLQQQLDMGVGEDKAQSYAVISGINEMLYEELSLDKAYGIYAASKAGRVSWQKAVMNVFSQAGIEGSEEVFTELANRYADAIVNCDFSQHNTKVRNYVNQGYSQEEAENMVKQEEMQELFETFLAGAASGGITGGATTIAGTVNYHSTAKNIMSDNAKVQALYDQTKASATEGSTASDIVNSKTANELTESDVANILESLNETGSESTEDFLTQAFMNRGESEEQAKQDAQLVLDISNTDLSDTLTDEEIEQRYFDNSELTDDERYKVKTANEIEQRNAAAIEANPNLANVLADYNSGKLQNPTTIAQVAMQVAKNENNAARAEKIGHFIDSAKNKVNTIADKVSGRSNSFVIGNTKSGQVGVMSFDDVSQNKAIVNTNQGKMDITDIDLGRSNEAMILKTGAEYENTKAANYLIDDYSGQDLQAYVSLSRYAYNLGQNGQPLSTLFNDKSVFIKNSLDSLQKMDQYNEHIMRMYNAGLETRSERSVEKVNAEKANAVQNKLDVAKDDKLYDFKSVIRDYTQANVLTDYAESRFNAAWITDTATLKTSANATNEYAAIVHEMFEFSRAMAAKEYEALKQAVLELAHDKLGYAEVQNAIKQYQNAYRTAGIKSEAKKTLSEATDEFVNDFMAGAFSTESGAQQFIEHVANNDKYSANEKASIFQSFADWVNHLLDTIKEFLTGKQQLGAKKALELEKMGVSLENIRDMALKAMDAAKVELNSQLESSNQIVPDDVKPSDVMYETHSVDVTDKNTLDFLENQDHITTYRAFQVIDGNLYSPMAAMDYDVDEKGKKIGKKLGYMSELGKWEQATESPNVAKTNFELGKKGKEKNTGREYAKFDLEGGDNQTGGVAYNPYLHSSNVVLNDQFAAAFRRNLVVVECVVPTSELNSGYIAEYAKNETGWHEWKSGVVATKIANQKPDFERQVFLSRWMKPVRILEPSEVAELYSEYLSGTNDISVPWNVVTPEVRRALVEKGVPVSYGYVKQINKSFEDAFPNESYSIDVSDQINQYMTMKEAQQMVQRAYINGNIKDWYDGEYKNGDEWLADVGAEEVAEYIENDADLYSLYLTRTPEILDGEYYAVDIVEAYQNGTLTGKVKSKASDLDILGKEVVVADSRFYSPKQIENARELWNVANQRANKSNEKEVGKARAEILLYAHNKNAAETLGITESELNKKLRSWSNYSAKSRDISNRINNNVASANWWAGIQNVSWINQANVDENDVARMVKNIEGKPDSVQSRYIARTMLSYDTHIDWSWLSFKFGNLQEVNDIHGEGGRVKRCAGFYSNADRQIVATVGPETIAHEMSHALDYQWGREISQSTGRRLELPLSELVRSGHMEYGKEVKAFVDRFTDFMNDLSASSDIRNSYYGDPVETFARFGAKFVDWTETIANGRSSNYEFRYTDDKFTQSQYIEFAKLLQMKSALDANGLTGNKIDNAAHSVDVYGNDDINNVTNRDGLIVSGLTYDKEGNLRVNNVDKISDYMWKKLFTGINRAGYGFSSFEQLKTRFGELAELGAKQGGYMLTPEQVAVFNKVFKLNSQTKAESDAEKLKSIGTSAARFYGTTTDYNKAGYMTVNGSLLDFSDGQRTRVKDHREINEFLDEKNIEYGDNYSDSMIAFMNMGNIRMQTYGIDIATMPTKQQESALKSFFNYLGGEVTVDLSNEKGDSVGSVEYAKGTSASRIINDIEDYFENGNVPKGNADSLASFYKYSINVDSDGNTLSEQQIEYFKDSKARDAEGRLLTMYHGTESYGFNTFEQEDTIANANFFTDNIEVAKAYSGSSEIYAPTNIKTIDDFEKQLPESDRKRFTVEKTDSGYTLFDDGDYADDAKNLNYLYKKYLNYIGTGSSANYKAYLNAVNPYIVDGKSQDWDALTTDISGEAMTTNEVVAWARENGYDSVIFNNIVDNGLYMSSAKRNTTTSTVIAVMNSNQIKSTNNLNPTTNDDIRYSIDVGDENFNAAIQEMMDDISGGVDRLANNMSKVMDFKSDISKRMISNVAKNIKKIYGSDIKSKDLEEKLMRMFNYLRETGSINAKDIELIRTSIGEQVVDSMRADDPAAAAEYDKFVSGIKTWDIALDEGQMQEVKNKFDSYYGFKRYMAGKLSLNKNGTLLDDIWTEICDLSGGALSYGTNPNNQPIALAEYINKLEPKARILDEQSYEEASMSVALEVFRQFFNETSKKDAAEFMRDEIKEYNKAVKQRYQNLYNEALKEVEKAKAAELERLQQEYENLTIEEQAAMAEGIGELESVQIQQLKEDTKKRIDELKKQNNEAIAKVKADYRNRKLTERANRAWIDTKRKLVKEIESLQNMLAHPKEAATKHVPIHLVLSTIDLLEAIQMDTGRNKAITERLAKLASVYESYKTDLNNDDGTNYGFDYDARIAADIAEVKAMFDNGRFYTDLYTPEMERLLEIVRALKTQIKNANNLIIDGQVRDARDVALDAITEVKNSRTENKNYVTDMLDRYGNQHLNTYRIMRKLSGYTDGAMMKLYYNLEEGGMREMQIQQQLNDIFKDVLEGNKNQKEIKRFISTKPNDLVDIGIVDETGKSVKVSRAMRMSIIMHSFNENNMRHILYGGLTIPDMKVYSQNKSKAYSEYGDVYRFLDYQEYLQAVKDNDKAKQNKMLADAKKKVDALQEDLSEWEKKFLAAAKKMFHEETGRLINDTSIALKGYTIARVKNYFPIKTDTDFTPTDFAGLVQNGTIEGMGMLKERVTSKKPMMLEDITDVIQRQIRNTSKYAAYAIPVRNFKMAMRQTFKDNRGEGTTLEKNIRKVWNAQNVDNLRNMLTAIETGKGRGEETFKVLNKIRANFAGAVLSINPSVAIKQAASYPTAAAVVGYLPLIQAVKDMPKGFAQAKGIEELEKRNPLLWYRAQGYGSQDLADAKASALINKLPTKLQKALGWTQFMDTGTVRTLEYAAKHYVDNNFKSLEKGSDAYWNKVSEVFTQVVTETQPNYDTLHKATIIRDGDSLAKMLVMFKTQPMQNFGILYDALGELDANINRYNSSKSDANKAKVKESVNKFAYAVTSQLMSAVTFSAMSIIARLLLHKIGRYRKGELEEWSWLAVLKEFGEGVVSCLTGMLLGGSEIYETATYYAGKNKYYSGIEVSSVEALNDFTTNTKYLADATTKLWEAKTTAERDEASQKVAKYSVKVGNYAGQLLGIPTGNIYNIIQSIYLYGVDAVTSVENGQLTFSSKTDVTDWEVATQYERMYDAVLNDDIDEYNKLVAEMIDTGKDESYIVGKVKSMIKDEYFSESQDRLETIENLVDIGFSEAEASHTVNQWYTGYKETNEYGPTKTLIRTAADDPSDANRKAVVEEVRNLIELGKTKDNFAKQLKQEFKDEYNEGTNKVNLNAILRQALVAAGYTDEEAAEVLAKWSK